MKLTIEKLNLLQHQLRSNLLPVKETGLGYQISKNLVRIDKAIEEHNNLYEEIKKKYFFKDESGEPIKYKIGKKGEPEKNALGELIKITEEELRQPGASYATYLDRHNNEFLEEEKQWIKQEIEVELHKFPQDTVKECEKNNKFDGIDISALLDVLIDIY